MNQLSNIVNQAYEVARLAHKGQRDKVGYDYIYHLERVALTYCGDADDEIKVIAFLHDALEDTKLKPQAIKEQFGEEVLEVLWILTRKRNELYSDYIQRIATNKKATQVKIADLTDNADISRINYPSKQDLERTEKYKLAKLYLETVWNTK